MLGEDDLHALVDQVWQTLLDESPIRADEPPTETGWTRADIAIAGDWSALVRVSCTPSAAQRLAAAMLELEAGTEADEDEVTDAMGEVANVIGGNIKGCLGGGTLGLPTVTTGMPSTTADPLLRYSVVWRNEPVVIELLHTDPRQLN